MPKKFKGGENTKAVEARARKAAVQQAEKEERDRLVEDEYWRDDDKYVIRKQQRKEDKGKKRQEQLDKKKEAVELLEQETSQLKSCKPSLAPKVTQAGIEIKKQEAKLGTAASTQSEDSLPVEENVNRLLTEGKEARSVEEAISVLSVRGDEAPLDRHPERRVKAAYQEFEAKNLPVLKEENSGMRLSQLRQIMKKSWQKSPENPLNQRNQAYNAKVN